MVLLHATCVDVAGMAILLRGASGSGKSDLALRLIDAGARLVADDQVVVTVADGGLLASAPAAIAGRLEVRGLGVLAVPSAASARIGLVIDLVAADMIERLPEPAMVEMEGVRLPSLLLAPFEASAAAKVRQAVQAVRAGTLGVE